ncbi:polycystin-1-like protein 2 [Oculina patagonica]
MKSNVMTKFNSIVDGFPGFLLAEFQRFGAQSIKITSNVTLPMAEIKVYCINASVKIKLMTKIRTRIKSIPMFHSNYLETMDTVNCTCLPATVNLKLSKTLEQAKVYYTTEQLAFKAEVQDSQCSSSAELISYWHITKATLKSKKFYHLIPGAIRNSRPVYSMWRRTSHDSYFYVSYVLRRAPQLEVTGYDYGYILLLQSPPVANISGVSSATKGERNITLNGSLSYDPHADQAGPLIFNWFCRRSHETLPDDDSLPVVDAPNENTSRSGGCYGYGPGRLSSNENILIVDVDKMEGGQMYVFELLVSNGVKSSRAVHWLAVKYQPASFFISCTYNCGPEVIPSKRMIIESNCTGHLCGKITHHHWSLFKRQDSNHSWVEIRDLAKRILTDLDNPSLVLAGKLGGNEYSLEMNTTYKIKGSITMEGGIEREDDITFQTVKPLSVPKKRCSVQPVEGFVLKTNFSVDCSGWHTENKYLTYNFSYTTSTGMVSVSGKRIPFISATLPQGIKSEDFNITIKVDISDQTGASDVDILTVKVRPLLQSDPSLDVQKLNSDITEFLKKGSVNEAASHAIAALSSYVDNKAKDSTLKAIAGAQISHVSQVTQLAAIVIMATEGRDRIPIDSLEDATTLLTKTTDFLQTHHDRDLIENVGGNILRGISYTLNASTVLTHERFNQLNLQDRRTDSDSTQRENRKPRETKHVQRSFVNAKKVTENILSVVDTLGTAVLSTNMPGQKKVSLKSDAITMTLQRKAASKIGSETLSGNDEEGAVTFPSPEVLFGRNGTSVASVDTQMLTLQVNPFVWTNSSKRIKSSVLRLDLKSEDGSHLNISGLSQPIELFIPEKDQKGDIVNNTRDHLFVKRPSNDSSSLRYHRIVIENDFQSAFVEIRPNNNSLFEVFVSSGVKPTPESYAFKTRIPDFSSCRNYDTRIGYSNCTGNPYTFSLSSNVTGDVGVHFIGIRLAVDASESTTRRKRSGIVSSCKDSHGRQKRSCIGVKDPPTPTPEVLVPQYDARTDVNYTMSVKMRSCLYWSERKQTWTSEGCKVGRKNMDGKLHCLCTHLSAFGGNIFVAPNPIDFDKVWTEFEKIGETGNFVVLSTVCLIFGMYFIGLVAARRADKKDMQKVVANVYLTTSQNDGHSYYLSIQTGAWKGCGTSACVGIVINGENGTSGVITLTDPLARRKYFSRGSVNNFTLTLPSSLGKLTDIRIWHDNTGSNPAWFLQQVFITDQQTDEMWYFFANQWLSLDNRSGSIELNIKAAQEDELTAFKPLFYARTARSLGEGHIWISVFTRPPHNPFTRCQRLTCCLSFVFTAMVTNAMFYQFDQIPTDTFKFGPLVMSWTQIKIGIQSSVIAIPANLLVILIFRNTKQATSKEIYDPGQNTNKQKTPGCLPPVFVYVAWCLSLLISLTGAAFTVFYSLMWGADISNQWLTSILVSLVQDILVTQPIKVLALATLLSLLIRKPPEQDPVIGPSLFKSEKGEAVSAKRKRRKELADDKDASSKKWSMLETVKEVVSLLIFGFLLLVVTYGDLDPARFQFTKSTRDIVGGFEEVVDTSSLWNWIDEVLVPGLYDVTWYNGQPFDYKEGFISNRQNFLVGMPRLRQIRLKKRNSCPAGLYRTQINSLFLGCLEIYSSDSEDRTPFNLPKWIPLKNHSHFPSTDICPRPWRYQSGKQINTLTHGAVEHSYDGGGYVADLGYNKESALEVIGDLRKNDWVDTLTAALFIEFTLFDPSTSLFCSVRQVYERLPTGKAVTYVEVRTLTLYPSTNANFQSFYEVCELLFLVVIVACFIVEIAKFFRQKRYFRQLWNWVELILLVVSVLAVLMSFLKGKYTSLYVKSIKSNPYDTFSSDYIMRWLDRETMWLSLAIFIKTLKLLRLIRFNHHICQMQGTIKRSVWPILSFSLVFAVAVVAFTHFGVLCFGNNLAIFSSFLNSLRVVLTLSVGKQINYLQVYLHDHVLGSLYLFLFLMIILFILINIFVAVLVDAYGEVREEQGDNFLDAELGTFMYNVVKKAIGELLNKIILASKMNLNKISRKKSGNKNNKCRDVKYSGEADSFIESRVSESRNGICMQIFEPADDINISEASPTFNFQYFHENNKDYPNTDIASDIKEIIAEDDLVADLKTRFIDIATELAAMTYVRVTELDKETAL